MMNGEYWARRFELLTDMELNKGEQFYGDLQRQYTKSIRRMQKDASYYLQKMADANGLSMTEARKLLKKDELEEFHWSVEEYIRKGRENAVDQSWMVELQNASTKFHVSRLEALQTQMRAEVEQLTGGQSEDLQKLLEGIYEDDYYRTAFEVQKGTGVGFQMMRLDKRSVEKAVLRPWTTDDQTFSDRLWKNKQTLLNNLQSGLSQAIAQGKNPSEVTDMISQKMGVSKSQAGRLVMTESAFIASSAQKDSFKELGVEEYEVVATLDTKTSDVCRAMDGKHFPMSQYQIGVTAPPFHPWCRSTTVPYFDDEFTVGEQRAMRDPKTGDYSTVPSNMKYEDWYKKYVDPNYKGVKLTTPEPTIEDKIKELEGKVADKEAEKKSAESELAQKRDERFNLGHDLANVERDIRTARSQKIDYESGFTSYDKFIRMGDGFDQWYDSIDDQLYDLEEQIKDIREKMHGLDYDDPDYDEKYEKLFNKRKALREKREELYEDQLTGSEYRVWRKTHKGKDYDKIISDLHDKKMKIIDRDAALGDEIQKISDRIKQIDQQIGDLTREIADLGEAEEYNKLDVVQIRDDIKTITDPTIRTSAQKKEFADIVDAMDKDKANLYKQMMTETSGRNNYYEKKTGWYAPRERRVHMDLDHNHHETALGRTHLTGAWETKFHEESHQLDHILASMRSPFAIRPDGTCDMWAFTNTGTVTGKKLIKAIDDDILTLMNDAISWYDNENGTITKHITNLGRISGDAKDALRAYLKSHYSTERDRALIGIATDAIGTSTGGRVHPYSWGFWGHPTDYCKTTGKNGATSETWASVSSALWRGDTEELDAVRQLMPNTVSAFSQVFGEVVKYATTHKIKY